MSRAITKAGGIAFLTVALGSCSSVCGFQQPNHVSTYPGRISTSNIDPYRQRRRYVDFVPPLGIIELDREQSIESIQVPEEDVPTEMIDAIRTFFFCGDGGPLYVTMSICSFLAWRINLAPVLTLMDSVVFVSTIIFWSFQEHFLHEKVLHSTFDWFGKEIHQGHHDKPYHQISIDPASLLLGWMVSAHVLFRLLLPLPLALTATIAYSLAGMGYEWAHYIVHTKVRFKSRFWKRVRENHTRHHLINHNYWFAFSLPWIDNVFGTNPPVRAVKRLERKKL